MSSDESTPLDPKSAELSWVPNDTNVKGQS